MTTDLILYNSTETISLQPSKTRNTLRSERIFDAEEIKLPEVLFITSFPPRECGIATYSQDLINALKKKFENAFKCTVCALESATEQHVYPEHPQYILNTDGKNSFSKTAFLINRNPNIHTVVMQHEFGFFANKEADFKSFFESITKPVIFVFHTVLPTPSPILKNKVQEMAAIASSIVVMTQNASEILINEYKVSASKISVIEHGTHLLAPLVKEDLKKKYHLSDRKVLSTFGLLSSSKGIEVTLDAMPAIISAHPDVLFLILGKTHPSIVKNEGEIYRKSLEQKVHDLHLKHHVRFVNEYLPLPILLEYLQLTDVYLFTSKDPNQAVSGTFSYALSCGCPVVSTPIPHALEVLSRETGIIVGFENPEQLSTAVVTILNDNDLRKNIGLNGLSKMAHTAWENSAIAHAKLFQALNPEALNLNYNIPDINLDHVMKMTTDFGMIQFAKIAQPDKTSGYTLDDNARALIAVCQHYEITNELNDLILINTYLKFIKHCFLPDGTFLNYVNEQKEFTGQNYCENLEDSTGRAIWALGYLISLKEILPAHFSKDAETIIEKTLMRLENIHSTRAMAFVIKGLHYQDKKSNMRLLKTFADRLVQMYRHEEKSDWSWFENYLTYGNSLLPEALLCAYLSTGEKTYKHIAKESFDFLLSKIFIDGKIKVISNKGWLIKDKIIETQIGGEQPIDIAYTIIALEKFYAFFNKRKYKQKAEIAFNWFLGENHLHQIIYNPRTGGCYDGLEEHNVNLNQGAESTLSYLMARLTIEKLLPFYSKESPPVMSNYLVEMELDYK